MRANKKKNCIILEEKLCKIFINLEINEREQCYANEGKTITEHLHVFDEKKVHNKKRCSMTDQTRPGL